MLVKKGPRHTMVDAEAHKGSLARHQIDQCAETEQRHYGEVKDGLDGRAEGRMGILDQLRQNRRDHVDGPRHHGDDDRRIVHRDVGGRGPVMDNRQRGRATFRPPTVGVATAAHPHGLRSSSPLRRLTAKPEDPPPSVRPTERAVRGWMPVTAEPRTLPRSGTMPCPLHIMTETPC